jgi:hypothetical protein
MRLWQHFGNAQIVRCVLCVLIRDDANDLHAGGRICTFPRGLRALWGVFPVVVRVHSGACRWTSSHSRELALDLTVHGALKADEQLLV